MRFYFFLPMLAILCFTGCKDFKAVAAQRLEVRGRLDAITQENNALEQKLEVLRKAVPPTIPNPLAAAQHAQVLERQCLQIDEHLAKTATAYDETVTSQKKLETEVASLRALLKR